MTHRKILPLALCLISLVVLFGWMLGVDVFKEVSSSWVTMKFSTAMAFLMSGTMLFLCGLENREKYFLVISGLFANIGALMGALMVSALLGVDSGLENVGVTEKKGAVMSSSPGVPSIMTMISFLITSLSGHWLILDKIKNVLWIGVSLTAIGAIAALGYMVDVSLLYYYIPGKSSAMAIHTAIALSIIGSILIGHAKESKNGI